MHEQEERAQPQWLYSAVDAKGRPTQGFVRAASVPLAIEVLARTRPDLRQVNVRTSGMTVGIEGATIEAVGAAGSPARLARLARDLIEQQEKPTLATSLVQLVRSSAWWIGGCVLALGVGIWRDWSLWWLTAIGLSLLLPFGVFFWMYRFGVVFEDGLRAHARGDLPALDAALERLTQAADHYPHLRHGAYDLAVKRAWHTCRAEGIAAAQRLVAAHPFPPEDEKARLLSSYVLPMAQGDTAGAAAILRQAVQRWPDEPVIQADLALMLARHGEVDEAQQLMAAIAPAQLPPMAEAFRFWIDGLAALHRQQLPQAMGLLTQAGDTFLRLGRQLPATWPSLAVCTGDLALAMAWSGRVPEARQTLQPVLAMVKAHMEPQRLALLRRAVAQGA